MGKIIGLVACSKKKLPEAEKNPNKKYSAQEMYKGRIFLQAKEYAERNCEDWFILSGKYGFLEKDKEISYYNSYIKDKPASDRRIWAEKILQALKKKGFDLRKDKFVILGGRPYYENLCKHLNCTVFRCYSGGIYFDKVIDEYSNNGGK